MRNFLLNWRRLSDCVERMTTNDKKKVDLKPSSFHLFFFLSSWNQRCYMMTIGLDYFVENIVNVLKWAKVKKEIYNIKKNKSFLFKEKNIKKYFQFVIFPRNAEWSKLRQCLITANAPLMNYVCAITFKWYQAHQMCITRALNLRFFICIIFGVRNKFALIRVYVIGCHATIIL